jgi:hypothetical protein
MAFTRESISTATYSEDGSTIKTPSFATWERDTVAAGMKWTLGEGWTIEVDAAGGSVSFLHKNVKKWEIDSQGSFHITGHRYLEQQAFPADEAGTLVNYQGTLYFSDGT